MIIKKERKIQISWIGVFIGESAVDSRKKDDTNKLYAYGVDPYFTVSVVFYKHRHRIDGVALDKSVFLPNRELYSYQLKNYFENQMNQPNRICMIYFSTNKKKLEKNQAKLLAKYRKNKANLLEVLPQDKFTFTKPDLGE